MLNVGTPDRVIRVILGALLIAAPFALTLPLWANPIAFGASIVIGAVLSATAVFSFCPIYAALGLSSKRKTVR